MQAGTGKIKKSRKRKAESGNLTKTGINFSFPNFSFLLFEDGYSACIHTVISPGPRLFQTQYGTALNGTWRRGVGPVW